MNKAELITQLAAATGLSKADARRLIAVLFDPDCHTPLTSIVRALTEEVTKETTYTSTIALRPCFTGRADRALP